MWNELLCWTKSKSYQLLYFINSIFSNVNMYKWSIEAHIYYFDILVELTNENAILKLAWNTNLIGQSILPESMLLGL